MMIHQINSSALNVLILGSALRTIFISSLAALAITAFRFKATSIRLLIWKSVLVVALAMPLLGLLLPPLLVPVPDFSQSSSSSATDFHSQNEVTIQNVIPVGTKLASKSRSLRSDSPVTTSASATRSVVSDLPAIHIAWPLITTIVYLAGAVFLLCRLIIGSSLTGKLVRASQPIAKTRLPKIVKPYADALGRSLVVAESELISVPVTVGAIRSTILLPTGWHGWDDARLEAVLAHELSHVAHRDALTQHLALLHRAIFWFSPLAWWLDRHLAGLAEEASDEAALATGTDRNDYARILLGFFEALQASPGRVWWQGVSMADGGNAEKRLERILSWKGAVPMGVRKSFITIVAILAGPVVYLAASARPSSFEAQASAPTAPSAASMTPAVPSGAPIAGVSGAPSAGIPAPAIVSDAPAAPGVAAIAPVAPIAPISPGSHYYRSRSQSSGISSGPGYSYAYGSDDEDRFVIVSGKSDSYTMSGSSQDIRHVERLKKQIGGDFIWFQRDEKSYIIRDQATIDRAKAFWAPQEELGKKQEELGKKQEALGKQQEELGKKQEEVRVNVPTDLTAKLDALKAKLQKLGPNATMEQMGDLQSEIGDLQSKIGDLQSQAGEQQGKLGEEQGKLGEQQGKLGEEQGKLGEEQGRLAEEAVKKTKALFDECIKNGKAQPEPESAGGASI